MTFKEIMDLRKEGRNEEALESAQLSFNETPDKWSASALFWCLYDQIKTMVQRTETEKLGSIIPDNEGEFVLILSQMYPLLEYFNSQDDQVALRCIKSYTLILLIFARNHPEFNLTSFIAKCLFPSLNDADWERPERKEGQRIDFPSKAEECIKIFYNYWSEHQNEVELSEEIVGIFEKAARKYKDYYQEYLVKVYVAVGRKEDAVRLLKSLIVETNKFYLWQRLAGTSGDKDFQLSCYCRAMLSCPQDDFKVKLQLAFANYFIGQNMPERAKCELDKHKEIYEKHVNDPAIPWRLREPYFTLARQIPQGTVAASNNEDFYRKNAERAERFVYGAKVETKEGTVVIAKDRNGKDFGRVDGVFIPPRTIEKRHIKQNDRIWVEYYIKDNNPKILSIRKLRQAK